MPAFAEASYSAALLSPHYSKHNSKQQAGLKQLLKLKSDEMQKYYALGLNFPLFINEIHAFQGKGSLSRAPPDAALIGDRQWVAVMAVQRG